MEGVGIAAFHVVRAEGTVAQLRPKLRRAGITIWIEPAAVLEKPSVLEPLLDIDVCVRASANPAAIGHALHHFAIQEQSDVVSFRRFGTSFILIAGCQRGAGLLCVGVCL